MLSNGCDICLICTIGIDQTFVFVSTCFYSIIVSIYLYSFIQSIQYLFYRFWQLWLCTLCIFHLYWFTFFSQYVGCTSAFWISIFILFGVNKTNYKFLHFLSCLAYGKESVHFLYTFENYRWRCVIFSIQYSYFLF